MQKQTYCSKSWTDINIDFENRTVKHCCKASSYNFPDILTTEFISNSPGIQERRIASIQNIAHLDCVSCWNDYNKGNSAFRDWANKWSDSYIKNNVDILNDDRHVHYIEIKTDRICDMSCIYCSSWSSSKISQEQDEPYEDFTRESDYETFKHWVTDFLKKPELVNTQIVFIFLGGEPTASERFYELIDFIESCAELTDRKIRLEICTNANSKRFLMDKILTRMDASKLSWGIGISNESYGEVAELIRHGLDWQRFAENFVKYIKHPKTELIVLSPTVNIFNLKTFHQYIDWVHEQFRTHAPNKEFTWFGNFTSWPEVMDIANLPKEYIKYIELAESASQRVDGINYVYSENFRDFFIQMKNRVGFNHRLEYKRNAEEFLKEKQHYKKTDRLVGLLDNLDL